MQNQWQIIENQCKINETSMKMKWKSLQLNAAQHTCRDREPWRDRSASEASPFSFKDFVAVSSCNLLGGVRNVMLGACVQCWSLLRSVTKLIKFKARFPFFVRQVFIFGLECAHSFKVSHPKVPQNDLNSGPPHFKCYIDSRMLLNYLLGRRACGVVRSWQLNAAQR